MFLGGGQNPPPGPNVKSKYPGPDRVKKLVVQADLTGKQRRQKEGKLSEANKTVPESKAEWDKVN